MNLVFQQMRNFLLVMGIIASFFRTSQAGLNRDLLGVPFVNFEKDESYLNITSIASVLLEDATECGFACLEMSMCFSYNLAAFPDDNGKLLCELLPSDKYNNSEKLNASKTFHHFSIPSPCSSWPCQNNGTCISNYANKRYLCHCMKGFTGKHCQLPNLDECSTQRNACDVNAYCVNTMNSYFCICKDGYRGDGHTCGVYDGQWVEYTPEVCDPDNRREIQFGGGITEEECKQRCSDCAVIEYWSGKTKVCRECFDPAKRSPYPYPSDGAYPPHVFVRV